MVDLLFTYKGILYNPNTLPDNLLNEVILEIENDFYSPYKDTNENYIDIYLKLLNRKSQSHI